MCVCVCVYTYIYMCVCVCVCVCVQTQCVCVLAKCLNNVMSNYVKRNGVPNIKTNKSKVIGARA